MTLEEEAALKSLGSSGYKYIKFNHYDLYMAYNTFEPIYIQTNSD